MPSAIVITPDPERVGEILDTPSPPRTYRQHHRARGAAERFDERLRGFADRRCTRIVSVAHVVADPDIDDVPRHELVEDTTCVRDRKSETIGHGAGGPPLFGLADEDGEHMHGVRSAEMVSDEA